jgi:hypothetical protein
MAVLNAIRRSNSRKYKDYLGIVLSPNGFVFKVQEVARRIATA